MPVTQSPRPPLAALIFDMDGVLVDSEPLHMQVERASLARLGVTLTAAQQAAMVGTGQQQMWAQWKKEYQLELDVDTLQRQHRQALLAAVAASDLAPMPGVTALLAWAQQQGLRCALASSSPRELVQAMLTRIGLQAALPVQACGDEVTLAKPDPALLQLVARRLGLPAAACLVIEDAQHGVSAALAAGMRCIGLRNPHSGEQDLQRAERVMNSHSAILAYLQGERDVQG